MSSEAVIDASLFMGMHSRDEATRRACKSFFVERLSSSVVLTCEQAGRCDDLVWRLDRAVQDAYYPFMDSLHTDMKIERCCYEEADLRIALESSLVTGLPMHERLLLGTVLSRGATLYTISPRLRHRQDLPVLQPMTGTELAFPARLERLYQGSLVLRVTPEDL